MRERKKRRNQHSRKFRGSFFKRKLIIFMFKSWLGKRAFKKYFRFFYGVKAFSHIAVDCKISGGFCHVFFLT